MSDDTEPTVEDFIGRVSAGRPQRRPRTTALDVFATMTDDADDNDDTGRGEHRTTETLTDDEAEALGRQRKPWEHGEGSTSSGDGMTEEYIERARAGNDKLREQNTGRYRG